MYEIINKYLYEIIEDFKDADNDNKDEILNEFMKLIWSNKNKRKILEKSIKFKIPKKLLNTDIGEIFSEYTKINYISYRSSCKDMDFSSLIRQKINNIYVNLFDERVCIKKEYINLLKKPKQMFYRWKGGEIYNSSELNNQLRTIIDEAEKVKKLYIKQKMVLEWSEYRTLIHSFFKSMFNNFIPLEEYESKNSLIVDIDTWNEDNFAVSYLCKSLDGYMRNYQKKYYQLPINSRKAYKRCILCGNLMIIQSKKDYSTKYCCICKKLIKQEKNRLYYNLSKSKKP